VLGFVLFRFAPDAAGEGIPTYLHALNNNDGRIAIRGTLVKFPATILTLAGGGSGGLVGPAGRFTSGVLSFLSELVGGHSALADRARTATICGMAATVAALLHAPIGGGIFAVEIIQRTNMRYRDLFPSILAGAVAVWFSKLVGWEPLVVVTPPVGSVALGDLPIIVAFSLTVGLLATLYVRAYAVAARVFRRDEGSAGLKVLFGGLAAAGLAWLVNPNLLGVAEDLTVGLIRGDVGMLYGRLSETVPLALTAVIMLLVRALATYLTTASGMSAGLTGPSIQIGLMAALVATELLGVPSDGALGVGIVAVGFVGMLAGSMNVPIAAAVIGMEVFGSSLGITTAFASIISFQMNRHRTVYDFAVAGSGRMDAQKD
jgi:CIC family chloride channel protein